MSQDLQARLEIWKKGGAFVIDTRLYSKEELQELEVEVQKAMCQPRKIAQIY